MSWTCHRSTPSPAFPSRPGFQQRFQWFPTVPRPRTWAPPNNGNSPSQKGILFLYTDGKAGQEASIVNVMP